MYTVTITKSGQITLPKELREFLGVKLGGKVTFNKTRDGVSIARRMSDEEFLRQIDRIHRKYGTAKKSVPDAVEAVRAFREGKISALNKRYEEKYL